MKKDYEKLTNSKQKKVAENMYTTGVTLWRRSS
jgi:hypothetical protein